MVGCRRTQACWGRNSNTFSSLPPWPSVVLLTQGSGLPPRWHLGSGPSAWLSWRREPPSSLTRWTSRYLGLQPGAAGWRLAQLAWHTHLAGHGELCVSPRQSLGGLSSASRRGFLLSGRLPRSAQGKPRGFGTWVGPDHKMYFGPHAVDFPIYVCYPQGTHLAGSSRNHL